VNLYVDILFGKRKRVDYIVIVGVVWRGDEYEMSVKGNDDGGWSGVMLWLGTY
jgi:hypothetical protein